MPPPVRLLKTVRLLDTLEYALGARDDRKVEILPRLQDASFDQLTNSVDKKIPNSQVNFLRVKKFL